MDSVVIIVLQKVNKQVEGKLKFLKKHRNKGTVKGCETREAIFPADILVDTYLIPNSVLVI